LIPAEAATRSVIPDPGMYMHSPHKYIEMVFFSGGGLISIISLGCTRVLWLLQNKKTVRSRETVKKWNNQIFKKRIRWGSCR